jgi:hypothetical protein
MKMTEGELNYAIRMALNHFDNWVSVTGVVGKGTSYYYEMQGIIEDAVRIGSKIACDGVYVDLSEILYE